MRVEHYTVAPLPKLKWYYIPTAHGMEVSTSRHVSQLCQLKGGADYK